MKTFCDLGSIDEMMNHYNDGGGHIESSNSYDEVANFNTIANAQTDMIFHYDEVASFGSNERGIRGPRSLVMLQI